MEIAVEKTNEELIAEYKETKNQALKQEITLRYVYLLKIIVRQMRNVYTSFSDADDMINEGIIALMDAIDTFDPAKNVKFESYVSLRIRGTIIDVARKQDWVPRSVRKSVKDIDMAISELHNKLQRYPTDDEIAQHLNISTEKYLKLLGDSNLCNILSLNSVMSDALPETNMKPLSGNVDTDAPEYHFQKKEMKQMLTESIDKLKENEKLVISLYYSEELSIKEIAGILNLSESRISQIHSKALFKLRHSLSSYVYA